ncbi:hypothetical protein [Paenibacillus sinopodophylli]|uniref:hypothetical protein n=1 Tax=Paenibacillus sinopodophylli TaxID=1837342 RepID=UPI00110CAFD3|nr:hypothetical protein [Paenibacillus sinopodophylli]
MKSYKLTLSLTAMFVLSAAVVPLVIACSIASGKPSSAQSAAVQSQAPKKANHNPAPTKPSVNNAAEATSRSTDANGYTIVISGGYETDAQDHGRPVVLIASALGVPSEVFRKAFSGVTPAGAGTSGPTNEEAQANKSALLNVLTPYGITNERLDEVSNYYRYSGVKGQVWKRTSAALSTTVQNGVVTGVKISNAGSGYTSAPTITITGPSGTITAIATVAYTTDFNTNGSLSAVKLQ